LTIRCVLTTKLERAQGDERGVVILPRSVLDEFCGVERRDRCEQTADAGHEPEA
jgi:hypothetical protein